MADDAYLSLEGLEYYSEKVKDELAKKVYVEDGKGLSTNDFTTAEKQKLTELENYTLPVASATTLGGIKVSSDFTVDPETGATSVASSIKNKQVSWTDVTDKPDVVLKSDMANVYVYKGSVASQAALPSTGVESGWVYNTEDTGMNYAWTGTGWDPLGATFTIQRITNEQIDALFA